MSIETERQLNSRCIELQNEIIQWGEKAKWALEQDDTGWWGGAQFYRQLPDDHSWPRIIS